MTKTVLALIITFGIVAALSPALAQRAPSRSCNQTMDQCVADRVAHGSKMSNAQKRCAEILAPCKKR